MGATPIYGFPYQELADAPNGPVLGQLLAQAVETQLARIDRVYTFSGARAGLNSNAGSGSLTTTAAYANLPAPSSVSFTKQLNTTRLKVDLHVSCIANAINTIAFFGVQVGGADYDVSSFVARGSAGITQMVSGVLYVPAGVTAGILTVQIRWKRTFGTGTVSIDGNDRVSLSIEEVV